jgi:CHAD domain-containing protein
MTHTPILPDLPIDEAGRLMMADELATVHEHLPALRQTADVTAVHETRKAIRRTFTLFKLFAPYYTPGIFQPYRRGLRRLMRRLAPCRDLAVFRLKLAAYAEAAGRPLPALAAEADARQRRADARLRRYLGRKKPRKLLDRYDAFIQTPGAGRPRGDERGAPLLVRHALPALIFQRVGAVRAYGDLLAEATPAQFHQLRIQFKELRYTLTFFEDLLGGNSGDIIELTRLMQVHLGDLNDASVAIRLLGEMTDCPEEAAIYCDVQQAELLRLTAGTRPLYDPIDRPEVRRDLALALADL